MRRETTPSKPFPKISPPGENNACVLRFAAHVCWRAVLRRPDGCSLVVTVIGNPGDPVHLVRNEVSSVPLLKGPLAEAIEGAVENAVDFEGSPFASLDEALATASMYACEWFAASDMGLDSPELAKP